MTHGADTAAQRRRPQWRPALAAVLALAATVAVAAWAASTPVTVDLSRDAAPAWVHEPSSSAVTIARRGRAEPVAAAEPIEIHVDAIGVTAPVIELGLNSDNTLEVPTDFTVTGWWSGGTAPAEPGPAVIVGHVDSHEGPAVFFYLDQLAAGDEIAVLGVDGSTTWFAVTHGEWHPKDDFPTSAVYGDTDEPTLRLVTCGGEFDRRARSYTDNFIVFATLIDAPERTPTSAR